MRQGDKEGAGIHQDVERKEKCDICIPRKFVPGDV
jgi:hypothetical protein